MGKKVLIVDDELHVVKIIQFKLKKEGFDVFYALNGEDAVTIAKKEIPDLILLDVMLPVMDGYKVFETLKEDEKTKLIPVVMISAKNQENDKVRAEKLGVVEYIFKPFSLQTVIDIVKRTI
jgi:two-component system alkaline phosphatase synthesis response regulator PhoP